ncbi:MAG: DUF302 domain-containing protein [Nitriliruptoraceae bacterium]
MSSTVNTDRYVTRVRCDVDVDTAEERVRAALAEVGFGVLTEIDVAATLKKKLDVDTPPYRILGACKPSYAHRALEIDPAIGGLLPCNVVVREHPEGGSELMAVDPVAMLGLAQVPELEEIAAQVADELTSALTAAARV